MYHLNVKKIFCLPVKCRLMSYASTEVCRNQHGTEYVLKKSNKRMEKFYNEQKICGNFEEFEAWKNSMSKPLPQSFRLNTARKKEILQKLRAIARKFVDEHG